MRPFRRSLPAIVFIGALTATLAVAVPGGPPPARAAASVCAITPSAPVGRDGRIVARAGARCPRSDRFSMLVIELERRNAGRWVHVGSDFAISRPDQPLRASATAPCGRRGKARYRTRAFTYALKDGKSRKRTRTASRTLRC